MDVQRVRLVLGDSKGPALTDKRKTLNDYSKCLLNKLSSIKPKLKQSPFPVAAFVIGVFIYRHNLMI